MKSLAATVLRHEALSVTSHNPHSCFVGFIVPNIKRRNIFYARTPSAAQIRIELQPLDTLSKPGEHPFVVRSKVRLRMIAKNDSDQRIKVLLVNPYYQNRPQLFKGEKLIPYRSEVVRIVRSKDTEPEFINLVKVINIEPYSSANLKQINLEDWYGSLEPGLHRLTNRYRSEIAGPWSADSEPVIFRVVPER